MGEYALASVVDAEGSFATYDEVFPDLAGEAFAASEREFPELFDGRDWVLAFRAFLLRNADSTVVVDTGVGPPTDNPEAFLPGRQGRLIHGLRGLGVEPAAVDLVFLTHLHVDHVGWCDAFPAARVVAHRADWDFFVERTKRSYGERFRRLLGDGRLELLDEGGSVAPGLVAVPTPGHTPGHMSLRVGVDGVILGDVAVHPAQVARPELVYVGGDVEPEAAAATRRRFLAELCEEGLLVGAGHFPGDGFGRVVERGDSFAWKPAG